MRVLNSLRPAGSQSDDMQYLIALEYHQIGLERRFSMLQEVSSQLRLKTANCVTVGRIYKRGCGLSDVHPVGHTPMSQNVSRAIITRVHRRSSFPYSFVNSTTHAIA